MLFDRSVRTELARTFGATLLVIMTIVITMMLIRTLGLAAGGAVAPEDVLLMLGYTALGHLPTMMTLSLFIAIVVSLGRMYRDSEMIIWFSSGLGLARVARPVWRAALPALVIIAALMTVVWPWVNRASADLRSRYEQRSDLSRVTPGVFQASRDGSRVFYIDGHRRQDATGENVFVLQRRPDGEAVTTAHAGRLLDAPEGQVLELQAGQRNESRRTAAGVERSIASFERYTVVVRPKDATDARELPPKATDTLALLASSDPKRRGELAYRFGMLLAAANLVLIGVSLAASPPRRASNWNLLLALLAFIIYFNLINYTQARVASGAGLLPALLLLHGTVAVLGVGLLRWRDGALRLPRLSRPRTAA